MKVRKLIKELKKYPDDYEVEYVSDTDYTEGTISFVKLYDKNKKCVWIG